jgi:L-alanine-DL-glutamate epimerase-like enolase superfamily enzyme
LRLDANRAWAPEAARTFLATLEAPQVELVEEPLADPEPKALAALRATSPVPLALDESLTHAGLEALLEQPPTDLLVLKPMRLGGVLACLDIARRARDAGLGVVVTGMLDGTPATLAAAHLAAALDATGTPATHGLATAGWLARDLAPPPPVAAGRLRLPDRPGLGCPCDGGGLA